MRALGRGTERRVLTGGIVVKNYDYDYPSTGSGYLGSELSKHEHPSSVAVTNVERRMLLRRVDEHEG